MDNNSQSRNYRKYSIRFRGVIDERHFRWFDTLKITPLPEGEMLIEGDFPDQSALFGVLNRLRDLNLELLQITSTKQQDE
jgi:hypothetical protein